MQPKTIGLRELRQQLAHVRQAAQKGQRFVVMAHHEIVFRIEPPQQRMDKKSVGKRLLEDFKNYQFHSNDPLLSQKIDEIVYEDRR